MILNQFFTDWYKFKSRLSNLTDKIIHVTLVSTEYVSMLNYSSWFFALSCPFHTYVVKLLLPPWLLLVHSYDLSYKPTSYNLETLWCNLLSAECERLENPTPQGCQNSHATSPNDLWAISYWLWHLSWPGKKVLGLPKPVKQGQPRCHRKSWRPEMSQSLLQ